MLQQLDKFIDEFSNQLLPALDEWFLSKNLLICGYK